MTIQGKTNFDLMRRPRISVAASRVLLALLVIAAMVLPARGQSVGSVSGTVTDPSGAAVAGAAAQITNAGTGLSYKATTGTDGVYRFASLPVGTYDLVVRHEGFSAASVKGFVLVTGHSVDMPVTLAVGGASQTVDVTGQTQEIQPTSSELQTSIEHKSMEDLPLNGRNPLQLVLLVPGAVSQNDALSFQSANTRIAVNGNRGTDNAYTLDGVAYTDVHYGTAPILPSPDALEEFTVKTSTFGAEEAGAGANIAFTTRSGTNSFHGTVFEYIRNDFFDARNYFAAKATPFKRNQYGGTVGGYIFRDRTFFFASYQGTRQVGNASPASAVVPTPAQAQGVFGATTVPIDPVIAKFLPFIPTSPTGVFLSNPRSNINDDQYLLRLDHELTKKDRLTVRFFYDDYQFQEQTSALTDFYGQDKFLNRNWLISEVHTFGPNLILTGAVGYTTAGRVRAAVLPLTVQAAGATVPLASPGSPDQTTITITGYSALSSGTPITIDPKGYNYRGHVIWIRGKHQITAGIDLLRDDEFAWDRSSQSGTYAFDGSRTGINAFADFLEGLPQSFAQKGTSPQNIYETKIQPFVQDDWKATQRLTLNIGLRWDPWLPANDKSFPQVGFVPGRQSTVGPNAPAGMLFSGDQGIPHAIFHRDMNNLAPRIGFAYDVTGKATTVVRGGYGIFYRPMPLNLQRFSGNTAAFRSLSVQIVNPASFENPYANFAGGTPFPWTIPTQSQLATFAFARPVTTSGLTPSASTSYVQEWSLTAEHQLKQGLGLGVTYVGNHMIKGMDATEGNPAVYGPGATVANTNARRLYQGLASVEILNSFEYGSYNGLQFTANKHSSHGFTLISNFSFSKCNDNDSQTTGSITVINKFNLNANYARCDFDIEKAGTVSTVYDVPNVAAFHGATDKLLNHWQVTGIFTAASGSPFNITSGTDRALSGTTTNSGTNDLADVVTGVSRQRASGASQLTQWFNQAAFTPAALGTFGNSGRNSTYGPGSWNLDFGVLKSFPIFEHLQATLRGEAFNAFNHANFNNPTGTYTSALFGKITTAGNPRVLQVSARIAF
jgi:Carboxypeptidase regulatory-like domain